MCRSNYPNLAESIHCNVGTLPIMYLWLPIEVGPRSKALWGPMIKKFVKKLSMSNRQYLSLGGEKPPD